MEMYNIAASLWRNHSAQDVAEYCLITALIALIGLAIFWHISGGVQGMWNSMNASLAAGNQSNPTGGIAGH